MKKHGFRSIFSLLLALMMVCSMLPTAAFAEGDVEEQSVVVERTPAEESKLDEDPPAPEDPKTFTVTYTDGADGAVFPDKVHSNLSFGTTTPAFDGTPAWEGYTFAGWDPAFTETLTGDVTYTAQWRKVQQEAQSDVQPEADGNGETDMQNGPDGRPLLNLDAGVYDVPPQPAGNVSPQAAGTITIEVRVFDGKQGYLVGYDTAKKANRGVQSEAYVIPELTKFVESGKFGKVTGVYGSWYWPHTTNLAVGTTIYWSNNSSTGTMTYYVDWYNPNGGGDNPTPPTHYLWNFTLHYDANGGTGAPADQFYGTNSKYEKSYDFTISGTEPTREGYTFKGWSDTKDGSVTYQKGGKCHVMQTVNGFNGGSVTKTLYAVWETETPPQPDKPSVPTDEQIKKALEDKVNVVVSCVTANSGHPSMTYPLSGHVSGLNEGGEFTDNGNGTYSYTISFLASNFVTMYSMAAPIGIGSDHELADPQDPRTVTLTWKDSTIGWTAIKQDINVSAKCKTENPPVDIKKPTFDELKALLSVKVECTNGSATHGTKSDLYALKNNDEDSKFEIGEVNQSGDAPTCTVTIGSMPYVAEFDGTTGKAHNPADTTKTVDLVYNKETGKWALKNANDATVVFRVACTTEEPAKPYKPNAEDLLSVVIHCKSDVHNDGRYDLTDGIFTVGEVEGNEADGYICKVTVEAAQYVNQYVSEMKVNHDIVGEGTKTVTLKYESALERWTVDSTVVTFDVECIPAPNISMLQVQVHCVTPNSSHMDESYDLPEDTTLEYVDANTRRITVQAAPYVEQYGNGHKLADGESGSKTITATWDGVKWNFDATSVTFYVKCETQPEVPGDITAEDLAKLKVVIHCTTNGSHTDGTYDLIPEIYRPDYSDGGFTCYIAVLAAPYVNEYISDTGTNHELVDPQKSSKTITLRWNTETKAWAADSNSVTFDVKCTTQEGPAQKYTVTYTDGVDGVEIFKDQVYADLTAGTATPKFNGTPTRVGYFFAGWNPAVADTVTGNATYTASWKVDSNNNGKPDDEEERYTVTYLDGANGKAFASQVYPGLLSGTATPKFNGTPVRSGYVFIGWSPVWSGTVTGNVTYTATWSTITGGLDKVPKTGDNGLTLALSALLLFSFCGAAACVVSTKKRG